MPHMSKKSQMKADYYGEHMPYSYGDNGKVDSSTSGMKHGGMEKGMEDSKGHPTRIGQDYGKDYKSDT